MQSNIFMGRTRGRDMGIPVPRGPDYKGSGFPLQYGTAKEPDGKESVIPATAKFQLFERLVHRKTGNHYAVYGLPTEGLVLEATGEPCYAYLATDGRIWHRDRSEMEDGRFEVAQELPFESRGSLRENPLNAKYPNPDLQEHFEFCIEQQYFRFGLPIEYRELRDVAGRRFGPFLQDKEINWATKAVNLSHDRLAACVAALAGYPVARWRKNK